MTSYSAAPTAVPGTAVGPRYALIPVHGYGIVGATVARMLDTEGTGSTARLLAGGEAIPYGALPVLLAESTVYGAVCVEQILLGWHSGLPKPWLVLYSDAPTRPVPEARYRLRALGARLAGMTRIGYLPSLRTVESAEAAMQHKDVQGAAVKLRRHIEGK